jgi:hypothetical protein
MHIVFGVLLCNSVYWIAGGLLAIGVSAFDPFDRNVVGQLGSGSAVTGGGGSFFIGLLLVIAGVAPLLLGYWYYWSRRRKHNEQILPAWQAAMRNWQKLFYCHRDDLVFDVETSEHCSPEEVQTFVYRTT